jgi:hypothetical protein
MLIFLSVSYHHSMRWDSLRKLRDLSHYSYYKLATLHYSRDQSIFLGGAELFTVG